MKDHAEILAAKPVQLALGELLESVARSCNLTQPIAQRLRLALLGTLEQGLEVKQATALVQAILEELDITPELHLALVRMGAEMARAALEGSGIEEPRGIFGKPPVTASAEDAREYDLEVALEPLTNRGPMKARAD